MKADSPLASPVNVAQYVSQQIDLCGKKQIELAAECGFDKPNIISMIKQGKTKVPINKIRLLAKALEIDEAEFMKLVLLEYHPDLLDAISTIIDQPALSNNESASLHVAEQTNTGEVTQPDTIDDKRFALVVDQDVRDVINTVAKKYKISQGAVIQVLFDNVDMKQLDQAFVAKREHKVEFRGKKKTLMGKLAKLPPEELARLMKIAERQK
jgi:transcriptional regulator with XRE-family HTH domain